MSLPDLGERLLRSFQVTAGLLQQLLAGMTQRRTAWIAARPSTLAEPANALEHLARQIADEEQARERILDAILPLLPPLPGVARERRHLDASAIATFLPIGLATRLRQAAGDAAARAREVRREIAYGERLLRFSARAHDALLQRMTGTAQERTPVYDRSARRSHAADGIGSLVDGRL